MHRYADLKDKADIEAEMPWEQRVPAATVFEYLSATAERFPDRKAVSFQLTSGARDPFETLNWAQLRDKVAQAANLFRRLGLKDSDTVAYLLPNCNEAVIVFLAGATACCANPVNPLLEPGQIAAILRETGTTVVVTLRAFPHTDLPQKVAEAVAMAPQVRTVLEVDLLRYLTPPKSWIVPLIRPRQKPRRGVQVLDFNAEMARESTRLTFAESRDDRYCVYFHTGGTTGMPKVARHRASGIIYQGWIGSHIIFDETTVMLCALPMFHVFAAYPVLMNCIASGGHMVMPTPQGFRGDGVYDNFWKLIERWQVSFLIGVPTALAKLMQRPVNADVSSLRYALCGSAALPVELTHKFEKATGLQVLEGYGMTEATCLISINPPHGPNKSGSVGIPFAYTSVRILHCAPDGSVLKECGIDEVGEICVSSPGVNPGETYTEPDKNVGLFAEGVWMRTGDLGRIDADGYVWITGRAKDLIIRGGHNIDPATIEEALAAHPAVAFVGAIGQPDAMSGELPCAYVELIKGTEVGQNELLDFAARHVTERAAVPKYIEIMPELPKTAVGKVLKNELRKSAIARIYGGVLHAADVPAVVERVFEDKKRGLVVVLARGAGCTDEMVKQALGDYVVPWQWSD